MKKKGSIVKKYAFVGGICITIFFTLCIANGQYGYFNPIYGNYPYGLYGNYYGLYGGLYAPYAAYSG
ncbi:MAG: hypothetical protein ACMUJM_22965, partial [bacterium]